MAVDARKTDWDSSRQLPSLGELDWVGLMRVCMRGQLLYMQ